MNKGRLEAFSDGVFSVAITLLVLDLHTDATEAESLTEQLWDEWPSFAAYALSFFVVGVIWVNHHALLSLAAHVDRSLMFYNLLLLMWVAAIPFTTATLAGFLRHGGVDSRISVVLYGITTEGMAISFTLMLWHMIHRQLLLHPITARQGQLGLLRFGVGTLLYPVAVLIGLLSPVAMLAFYAVLNAFYIFEQTPILPSDVQLADTTTTAQPHTG